MFIKTKVSIVMELGNEKGVQIIKELGYLYKGNLNLIKRDTHSWVLSHEHSGYLIVGLNMPLDLAKQVTMIVHSLLDWTETNKDTLTFLVREKEETMRILKELSYVRTEEEITEIRDRLFQNVEETTSISDLIDLIVA